MTAFIALLLGVVQGLTEFIPVSSSGHLALAPYLLGVEPPGLAFDVALHLGTALALIVAFRAELLAMFNGVLGRRNDPDARLYRQLGIYVVGATVPVAVVGLLFEDTVAALFLSPAAVSGFLVVTAAILYGGEKLRSRRTEQANAPQAGQVAGQRPAESAAAQGPIWTGDWVGGDVAPARPTGPALPLGEDAADPTGATLDHMNWRRALLIGAAQMLAILPGVSRSGTTIVAGMSVGMTRSAAARFSFLLALPALIGAFVLSLPDLAKPGPYSGIDILIGVTAAFVSGLAAIRFLLRLVAKERLTGFALYCLIVAGVGLFGLLIIGPPSSV